MTQVPKLFEVIYALGWAVRQLKAFEAHCQFSHFMDKYKHAYLCIDEISKWSPTGSSTLRGIHHLNDSGTDVNLLRINFLWISKSSKISYVPSPHLRILLTFDIFTDDKKSPTPDKISRVVRSAVSVSGCPYSNLVPDRGLSLSRKLRKILRPGFPCHSSRPPGLQRTVAAWQQRKLWQQGRVMKHDMAGRARRNVSQDNRRQLGLILWLD